MFLVLGNRLIWLWSCTASYTLYKSYIIWNGKACNNHISSKYYGLYGLNHIVCLCSHMFILVLTVKLFTALLFFRKCSTDAKTVFILLKIQIGLYISHLIEVFEPSVLIFLFGPLPTKGFQSDTQIRMVPVNTICVTIEIHLTRISMW